MIKSEFLLGLFIISLLGKEMCGVTIVDCYAE